jgi:hypothetical protein
MRDGCTVHMSMYSKVAFLVKDLAWRRRSTDVLYVLRSVFAR